jgi:hypothetical protein
MWLAEGYAFTPDFKRLTDQDPPRVSPGATAPFAAEDVQHPSRSWPQVRPGVDAQQGVECRSFSC